MALADANESVEGALMAALELSKPVRLMISRSLLADQLTEHIINNAPIVFPMPEIIQFEYYSDWARVVRQLYYQAMSKNDAFITSCVIALIKPVINSLAKFLEQDHLDCLGAASC